MMSSRPLVSIGLPVYNGETYLEETILSILNQTYDHFELIISDNASTDRSPQICQDLGSKDERIRFYQNEGNLGAAANYNRVFQLSTGDFFKWSAYDDPYAPTCLEKCVEALLLKPDVIMAYPRTILIDEHDNVIEYHDDGFNLDSPRPHERLRKAFASSAWCHPVFGLVRSEILTKTALIGNYYSSDKTLLGEFAVLGKCYEVPEHLSYRRLHPQISTRVNTSDEDMAAWYDPAARKRVLAPRWRRFFELSKAVQRAPIGPKERLLCYRELLRFYVSPERLPGLIRDFTQFKRRARRLWA